MAEAATTSAPAALATSIVSRVDPPVVTTSSTTSTRSPAAIVKPRRSFSAPSSRSAKSARAPMARATSCPMTIPPSAGDNTVSTCCPPASAPMAAPRASASARMLQHERTLQVPGAVQAGRQPEVPFEQRLRPSEQIEHLLPVHVSLPRVSAPPPSRGRGAGWSRTASGSACTRPPSWSPVSKPWFSTGYSASSQFSLRSSISRCASRTESWKWTLVSTMPWQMSSAPFSPSAK